MIEDQYTVTVWPAPIKPVRGYPGETMPGRDRREAAFTTKTRNAGGFHQQVWDSIKGWAEDEAEAGDYVVIATDGSFGVQGLWAITIEAVRSSRVVATEVLP